MGTAPYLSPEQVRGTPPTPASDVYSLGLVLLEALTGTRAYPGTPTESAIARLTRRPDLPASLPPDLPALVEQMTADDPAARPTAAEVSRRLGARPAADVATLPETAAIATLPANPTAVLSPADIPTVAVRRRRPALAWLALPVAAAAALVIVLLANSGHGGRAPVTNDLAHERGRYHPHIPARAVRDRLGPAVRRQLGGSRPHWRATRQTQGQRRARLSTGTRG